MMGAMMDNDADAQPIKEKATSVALPMFTIVKNDKDRLLIEELKQEGV